MSRRTTIKYWMSIAVGIFCFVATAEKLPPPADEEYPAGEIMSQQLQFAGKIIKVKFNRIEHVRKIGDEAYIGTLRSFVKPKGNEYNSGQGVLIRFAQGGLGLFSKSISRPGSSDSFGEMQKPDREGVYVQIGKDAKDISVAVGDQYKKDGEDGEYKWSVDTEIPDLADKRKVSVDEAALFTDQLRGKILEIEFYIVEQLKSNSVEEYTANISSGSGHTGVMITFPVSGLAFFKEIEGKGHSSSIIRSIYAKINVTPSGLVTLEAKGRRTSGAGDEIEYRW